MKYWLIAVSSAVSTSFKSSMISGVDCMRCPPGGRRRHPSTPPNLPRENSSFSKGKPFSDRRQAEDLELGALGIRPDRAHLADRLEGLQQLDGDREDDRRVLLGRDLHHRLELAELQGAGGVGDHVGRLTQLLRGLKFAFGGDDLGPPFTFRFRL